MRLGNNLVLHKCGHVCEAYKSWKACGACGSGRCECKYDRIREGHIVEQASDQPEKPKRRKK